MPNISAKPNTDDASKCNTEQLLMYDLLPRRDANPRRDRRDRRHSKPRSEAGLSKNPRWTLLEPLPARSGWNARSPLAW
jgi:hypothetical protein